MTARAAGSNEDGADAVHPVDELCYLCGKAIERGQAVTGDHVVPVVFLGKKQPKTPGFDYAGRIRTHQSCNNHFTEETFFKQAIHLLELVRTQQMHGALQSNVHSDIQILPVTHDQVPLFTVREFKRFGFIDTRDVDPAALKDPGFFEGRKKINLHRVAAQAAAAVMAKSSAALLVKRMLRRVPAHWRIYAAPYEIGGEPDMTGYFGAAKPFGPTTRAAIHAAGHDEWFVVYQHRNYLTFLLIVLHEGPVDLRRTFSHPDCEIYAFSGDSLQELASRGWQMA